MRDVQPDIGQRSVGTKIKFLLNFKNTLFKKKKLLYCIRFNAIFLSLLLIITKSSALFDRPEGGLSAEDSYGIVALAKKASADSVG